MRHMPIIKSTRSILYQTMKNINGNIIKNSRNKIEDHMRELIKLINKVKNIYKFQIQ